MGAAILNPSSSTFSKPTDKDVVILPYAPGDPNYSPILTLHNYTLPSGKNFGDIKGICQAGQTCDSSYILASDVAKGFPYWTIFVVASAQ
jgi:hypothetical protein